MSNQTSIEGLRGIAVLFVLLYHAQVSLFSGGFIGVDVFFVISGYVITLNIIALDKKYKKWLLIYAQRRAKRILPPLYIVMLVTTSIGTCVFDLNSLQKLGQSIIASILFISNIYFWKESGYFDISSHFRPLLHTWSLSVEVQLYLMIPFIIIAVKKWFTKWQFKIVLLLTIFLFIVAVIGTSIRPAASFYLMPTRSWEFMVGVCLAWKNWNIRCTRIVIESVGLFGLALIFIPTIFVKDYLPFPGVGAIPSVLGAALLIISSHQSEIIANKFLSIKYIKNLGLISYSLYLWHWPVFAYWNFLSFENPNFYQTSALIGVSLILATISWKYVELPFRSHTGNATPSKSKFFLLFLPTLICVSSLVLFFNTRSINNIYNEKTQSINVYEWAKESLPGNFFQISSELEAPSVVGIKGVKPTSIIWGDSHAVSLLAGFHRQLSNYGLASYVVTKGATPPVLGVETFPSTEIARWNNNVLQFILRDDDIRTVFLASAWPRYTSGLLGNYVPVENNLYNERKLKNIICDGLSELILTIRKSGREVVFINDVPTLKFDPVRLTWLAFKFPSNDYYKNKISKLTYSRSEYIDSMRHLNQCSASAGARLLDPTSLFFSNEETSKYLYEDRLLYTDDNHLSLDGSYYAGELFHDVLLDIKNDLQK